MAPFRETMLAFDWSDFEREVGVAWENGMRASKACKQLRSRSICDGKVLRN